MRRMVLCGWLVLAGYAVVAVSTAIGQEAEKLVPLFNGKNLDGWVNVDCDPDTFTVKEGMIVSTGIPTGFIRTVKQYENFIMELEWCHLTKGGDSGVFLYADAIPARGAPFTRSIQVQIQDGNKGDIFPIHGAVMTPEKPHPNGWMRSVPIDDYVKPVGEWNHYRIESRDGMVTLKINGRLATRAFNCNPRKGFICLQAETKSPINFRNIRIAELPGNNPHSEVVAMSDPGLQSIFAGLKMQNWKTVAGNHWHAEDWILYFDGKGKPDGEDKYLWTKEEYENFVMLVDWRFPMKPKSETLPMIMPDGSEATDESKNSIKATLMTAGRSAVCLRGSMKAQIDLWNWPIGSGVVSGYRTDTNAPPEVRRGVTPMLNADNEAGLWNRAEIAVIDNQITITINGLTVVKNAALPGLPPKGPIGLQQVGDVVLFTNLFVKPLAKGEPYTVITGMKQ